MGVRRITKGGKPRLLIDFYYTDESGESRRFRKTADVQTMTAAKAEEKRLRDQTVRGGSPYTKKVPTGPTFKEFVDKYWHGWAITHYKPSTQYVMKSGLRNQILPAFGSMPLNEITTLKLQEYAGKVAAQGINPMQRLLIVRSVLSAAHTLGVIESHPKLPIKIKQNKKLLTCPDASEVRKLIEVASGWLKVFIALAAYAGLRSGEIRALHVGDVDWKRRLIFVRYGMSANVLTTTKTNTERTVPIAPDLEPILRGACEGKADTDRVLLNIVGKPVLYMSIWKRMAHLSAKHDLRRWTPHSLRHSFCTTLLERGASVELVRVVAGHSSIRTTSSYLHAYSKDAYKFMGTIQAHEFEGE
ncbi:MAG: site-specific integrase [Polyangiaceae bacterium]|nr:site-specific integrase [Polyangiaceae bacterium]